MHLWCLVSFQTKPDRSALQSLSWVPASLPGSASRLPRCSHGAELPEPQPVALWGLGSTCDFLSGSENSLWQLLPSPPWEQHSSHGKGMHGAGFGQGQIFPWHLCLSESPARQGMSRELGAARDSCGATQPWSTAQLLRKELSPSPFPANSWSL